MTRRIRRQAGGWATFILPYMEERGTYKAVDFTLPVEAPKNAAAVQTMIKTYICPSDILH